MHQPELRASQLIMSFGPGALVDLPESSVIMGGLEQWQYDRAIEEHCWITEARLTSKLEEWLKGRGIPYAAPLRLKTPPPKVEGRNGQSFGRVDAFIFPEWFVAKTDEVNPDNGRIRSRLFHIRDLENTKSVKVGTKRFGLVPMRFVKACPRGHVSDVDWGRFVPHREQGCGGELFLEEDGTTGDIGKIFVTCSCTGSRGLGDAIASPEVLGIGCEGRRPWLGADQDEECDFPHNRLLTRSASNAYFSISMSVISIPESSDPLEAVIRANPGLLKIDSLAKFQGMYDGLEFTNPALKQSLGNRPVVEIWASIDRLRTGEKKQPEVKEAEFNAFTSAEFEAVSDRPDEKFFVRSLPEQNWRSGALTKGISKVVLVHRLQEVIAQVGFTRLEAFANNINGEIDESARPAMLARSLSWLPAVENRGEGIFIQFSPQAINDWLLKPAVVAREDELKKGYATWKKDHKNSTRPFHGAAYYMLHSLSHMLLTSLSLECGYPMSSMRERIYAEKDRFGILIYTGSSDSEGTLGGLVEAGRNIGRHLERALAAGKLCSNDPVCSHHRPEAEGDQNLSGSACHGCLLISETSCEQHNNYLDRSLVVPTLATPDAAFFA